MTNPHPSIQIKNTEYMIRMTTQVADSRNLNDASTLKQVLPKLIHSNQKIVSKLAKTDSSSMSMLRREAHYGGINNGGQMQYGSTGGPGGTRRNLVGRSLNNLK